MHPSLFLLLSLAGATQPADAWRIAEPRLSPQYERCTRTGDAARGVHPAMMDCIEAELHVQDRRLNRTYRSTLARLNPGRQAALRRLQRRWIDERDRMCRHEWQESGGGQASDLNGRSCHLRETVLRTLWLERHR